MFRYIVLLFWCSFSYLFAQEKEELRFDHQIVYQVT